jgi:broad specificity phosphatase PhoE
VTAPRLFLVRHGESMWNRLGLVQGQTPDVPLTRVGHAQAREAARRLAPHRPARIWTSDQLRARQTADHIGAALGLVPRADSRLRERSYGRDEGRAVPEVPSLGRWDISSEDGEAFAEVVTRVGDFLDEQQGDEGMVVVTHGDTLRAAMSWLGVDLDEPLRNGHVVGPIATRHKTQAALPVSRPAPVWE